MNDNLVTFTIGKNRISVNYPKDSLKIGAQVYVRSKDSIPIEISTKGPNEKWIPYTICWISPSSWTVFLAERFEIRDDLVSTISGAVDNLIDTQVVRKAVEMAAKDIRPIRLYLTDEFENSRIQTLYTVAQRLDLCRRLRTRLTGNELRFHHLGLITYLLLTCFDCLGQPAAWLSFPNWLKADSTKNERQAAVSNLDGAEDPILISEKLYRAYNELYGFTNSFFRFLHELITIQAREELLASIRIIESKYPPDVGSNLEAPNKKKEEYLFRLRNDYTHRAKYVPGLSENQMGKMIPAVLLDQPAWHVHEQRFLPNRWETIMVRNWPATLYKAVQSGLLKYIQNILSE